MIRKNSKGGGEREKSREGKQKSNKKKKGKCHCCHTQKKVEIEEFNL